MFIQSHGGGGASDEALTCGCSFRAMEEGEASDEVLTYGCSFRAMEERLVPFRESKLTRLFQNYFVCRGEREKTRQGKITMFVNISNNASVFDETLHVLKFSALTSKVGVVAGIQVGVVTLWVW